MRRRGFTLIEVLVALVVTSTVLLVGYTVLAGSADTRDRLAARDATEAREARTTALLRDVLRHVVDAALVEEAPLRIVSGAADGVASDSLIVLSRGINTPQGTGRLWRVVCTADRDGVVLSAVPLLRVDDPPTQLPPPLEARLSHLRGVRVEVLEREGDANWRPDWPVPTALPAAVSVTFESRDGAAPAPVVVRLVPPGAV